MPQFDVHRNLGRSRSRYPFLVVVQSGLLDRWERRVVVPLSTIETDGPVPDALLTPILTLAIPPLDGVRYLVAAQEIGNVPQEALGERVANLRDEAEITIGAIDWVLSQGFG